MTDDAKPVPEVSAEAGASCLAWTAALIRILALWLVASGAIALAMAVASFGAVSHATIAGSPPGRVVYPAFVAAAAALIVAALLWRNAERLSDVVWRDLPEGETTARLDAAVLQRVVRQGIGLYVAVQALAAVPTALGEYLRGRAGGAAMSITDYPAAHLIGLALQLAIGLWLFLGSSRIAGWLDQTRHAR